MKKEIRPHRPISENGNMPCCWCADGIDCKRMRYYVRRKFTQHNKQLNNAKIASQNGSYSDNPNDDEGDK